MNIQNLSESFQETIIKFLNYKDFSSSGQQTFKHLEHSILQFTKLPSCLQMCIYILHNSPQPAVQYFASKFLKDKLMYDFDQLDGLVVQRTHQQLIEIIGKYQKASAMMVTNLSLCLVFMYIQYAERVGGIVEFLRQSFVRLWDSPDIFRYYFKVLQLLPDEINNSKVVIDEEKRLRVLAIIESQQKDILVEVHQVMNSTTDQNLNHSTLLRLFSNWLEIGHNVEVISSLQTHSLLHLAFRCLDSSVVSDDAMVAIETVMDVIDGPEQNQELFAFFGQSFFLLLRKVEGYLESDAEVGENCIRLLSMFGGRSSRIFVEKFDGKIREYLLLMVQFTKMQDLEVFQSLIEFWDTLLFQFNSLESATSAMTKKDGIEIVSALFKALCLRLRYSLANLQELNTVSEKNYYSTNENIDDLYQYRDKARDVFEKISDFLGHEVYLCAVVKSIKQMPSLEENKENWQLFQSYLFSLRDVLNEYPYLSKQIVELVQMYENMVHPYEQVKKDFIRIFQQLFSIKEKNTEFLNKLFLNVTKMLKNGFLAERAEKAFEKGCKENTNFLSQNIESVIQIYINNSQRQHILKGIIEILRKKPQMMKKYLPELLKHPLQVLRQSQGQIKRIQCFETFFAALSSISENDSAHVQEILYFLLTELWPILQRIISAPTVPPTEEDPLVEKACKLLKLLMRRVKHKFLQFIHDIFSTVLHVYKTYPMSSFVYLLEITITVYGNWSVEVVDYLQSLYLQFYEITIYHVSTIESSFQVLQDLIDDFLGLHIRIFVYNALILLNTGKVEEVLKFTSKCLVSGLPRLAASASHLLESIFMIYWRPCSREKYQKQGYAEVVCVQAENMGMYGELLNLLRPSVTGLIQELLNALEGVPPEFVRDNVIDCLKAVFLAFPLENLDLWWSPIQALSEDIFTQVEKNKFKEYLSQLTSNDEEQFFSSQRKLTKLLYTITKRYAHRQKRQKIGRQQ